VHTQQENLSDSLGLLKLDTSLEARGLKPPGSSFSLEATKEWRRLKAQGFYTHGVTWDRD